MGIIDLILRHAFCLLLLFHGVYSAASLLGVTSTTQIMSGEIQQQVLAIENKVTDLYNQLDQMRAIVKSVPSVVEGQWASESALQELDKKIGKQLNNIEEFVKSKPSNLGNEDNKYLISSELDIFEKRMVNMITSNEHKFDKFNNTLYNDIDTINNNINIQLGYILNDILSLRRTVSADLISNITLLQENFNSSLSGHDNIINDLTSKIGVINELYAALNASNGARISESTAILYASINHINETIDSVNNTIFVTKELLQHDLMTEITKLKQEVSFNYDSVMTNVTACIGNITDTNNLITTSLQSLHSHIHNNLTILQGEVYSNISLLIHEANNNMTTLEHMFHGNISSLNQDTNDNITALYSVFRSSHTDLSEKIAAEIGDLNNSIRNNLEKSVLQQEQQIALISNEVTSLNSTLIAVNTSILDTLDRSNTVIFSNISTVNEKVSQLTSNLETMNYTFHHQLHNATTYLKDIISATQVTNSIEMVRVNETLLQLLSHTNGTIHEYIDDLRNQVSVSSENIKLLEKSYYKLNENYNNLNNNLNEMSGKLTEVVTESLATTQKTIQEYLEGTNNKINNIQQEIQATTTSITKLYTQHAVDNALNEKHRDDYEKKIKSLEDHIKVLEEKIGVSNININSNDVLIKSMEKRLLAIEADLRK